jgi:hypothetical protein
VYDGHLTDEVISTKMSWGILTHCIYISRSNLRKENLIYDIVSNDEAISAYEEWQKHDIMKIENYLDNF